MTSADLVTRFPEFANFDEVALEGMMDECRAELNETVWGTLYDKGVLYLSASKLKDMQVSNLRSEKIGELSVTYKDEINFYKREFKKMCRLVGGGLTVV